MRWNWMLWCGGLVLLMGAAAVGGRALRMLVHGDRPQPVADEADHPLGRITLPWPDASAAGPEANPKPLSGRLAEEGMLAADGDNVRYFPSAADRPGSSGLVAAQAEASSEPPGRLSAPRHAAPIAPGLEDVLIEELPHASPEEREIWSEQFEGLPAEVVRDILRLRRRIGPQALDGLPSPAEGTAQDGGTTAPAAPPYRARPEEFQPAQDGPSLPSQWRASRAALDLARDAALHNVANAQTPGFKRRRVLLGERRVAPQSGGVGPSQVAGAEDGGVAAPELRLGTGVEVLDALADHAQGPIRQTGRALDLAIEGEGFFQIQGDGETLYTRAGSFRLNDAGDVVLAGTRRTWRLDPPLSLPSESHSILVSPDGRVTVRRGGHDEAAEIGRIQLVRFIAPCALEPRGGNLFAPGEGSGSAQAGPPAEAGRGRLRQFALEGSNVDLAEELRALKHLRQQLAALDAHHGSPPETDR